MSVTKTMLEQLGRNITERASAVRELQNEVQLKINGKWHVMVYDEASDLYNVTIFNKKYAVEAEERGLDFEQAPDMILRSIEA